MVLVKEFENLIEKFVDVIINPVSVLELDNKIQDADIRHDLMTSFARSLEIVQEQENNSNDLLLVKEVEYFHCSFNDIEGIILEEPQSKLVERYDPEGCYYIIGNLVILSALSLKKVREDFEARVSCELESKLIGL